MVLLLIIKTFFFLRIFSNFTPIVIMLKGVLYDLRVYLLVYGLLICVFALMGATIGLGRGVEDWQKTYKHLGGFIGHIMNCFRVSIGDFDSIGSSTSLDRSETYFFWLVWVLTVLVTSVIFLNFIIAQACATYNGVVTTLDAVIMKERAALALEAEQMTFIKANMRKHQTKYVVVRTAET